MMKSLFTSLVSWLLLEPIAALNFSTLVVFGDSYTDNGVRKYTPDANGNVGTPVRRTTLPVNLLAGAETNTSDRKL